MRARLVSLIACVGMAGCYAPLPGAAADRGIAAYQKSRTHTAALAFHVESEETKEGQRKQAPTELALADAIDFAKSNSARIAELRARVAAAKATTEARDRIPNPELRVAQIKLDEIVAGEGHVRPSVRYQPRRPGEISAEVAEAKALEGQAEAELVAEERALEAETRWLFEDVLLFDAEIKTADAVMAARQELAAQMKTKLDMAIATSLDDAFAELAAVDAAQDSAELSAKRALALARLLDVLGLDPSKPPKIVGEAPMAWPPPKLPDEQTLVEEAIVHDGRIAAASARMDAQSARIAIERGKQAPWLTFVEVGYEFGPKTTPGLGFTLQAGVDLPIFDTNRNNVRAREATLSAEKYALIAEVERVAHDVRLRLREAQAAEALVTKYRASALPVAERAQKASKQALEGRGIDVIRALMIDERRVLVELRLLQLMRRYRIAVSELRRVVGGRLPSTDQ